MKKYTCARALFVSFFCFILTFAVLSFSLPATVEDGAFADTEIVVISTAEEMVAFSQEMQDKTGVGMRVELQADLDLTATEEEFLPIGTPSFKFEGTFLGHGHVLTVDIDRSSSSNATGIFAYTGSSCYISELVVKGAVQGKSYVGGIVGDMDGGRMEKCISFAEVNGASFVGGLVGSCRGVISQCSSFSEVRGRTSYFGGIVGVLNGTRASVSDSVFIGKIVSGGSNFGGIAGSSSATMKNNFVIPTFEGTLNTYGTLIGSLGSVGGGVSYCYGIGTQKAIGSNSSGSNPPTLSTVSSYEILSGAVSFSEDTLLSVCTFDVGFGYYPCPSYLLTEEDSPVFTSSYDEICREEFRVCLFEQGTAGTIANPFVISDVQHWKLFVTNSHLYDYENVFIKLACSLNIGEVKGVGSIDVPFKGSLAGQMQAGDVAPNITFTEPSVSHYKGLFSVAEGAKISNLSLVGRVSNGNQYVGCLVGLVKGEGTVITSVSLLDGCSVAGVSYVGGIVGGMEEGAELTLSQCSSFAIIYGERIAGGLIGSANGTFVCSDCHSDGTLNCNYNGAVDVGGIFGNATGDVELENVYNKGPIQAPGSTNVGGIGGKLASENCSIASCYVLSNVVGRFNVGGLFGTTEKDLTLEYCVYVGTVTGGNSLGAFVGLLPEGKTLTVSDGYCVFTFVRDKTISLTEEYRAFCVSSPKIEKTMPESFLSGTKYYEYSAVAERFFLTEDVAPLAGKNYYLFLSTVEVENVYYNSDLYRGANTNGATGVDTVVLSDGTLFTDESHWKKTTVSLAGGYYPVLKSASQADFAVSYFAGGSGTKYGPFQISSEQQLRNFATLVNGYDLMDIASCSDMHRSLTEGNVQVSYCDCNVIGVLNESAATPNLSKHSEASLSSSALTSFDSLDSLFATFIAKFVLTDEVTVFHTVSGDEGYAPYLALFAEAKNLFDGSENAVSHNIGFSVNSSAVIGISKPYIVYFDGDEPSYVDMTTVLARLFGAGDAENLLSYASSIASAFKSFADVEENVPVSYRAHFDGAVYTDDRSFILPYAFRKGTVIVLSFLIVDNEGNLSVWLSDTAAASAMVNVNVLSPEGGQVKAYGRCRLFEEQTGAGYYFAQTADINLTRPFFVISYFTGTFNGNDHTISSWEITSAADKVGFFDVVFGTLKNICLDNGYISAPSASLVGGLAAESHANVTHCFVAAEITCPSADIAGGLFGRTDKDTDTSFFAGNLTGGVCVGGLIGQNEGTVESCFTTGAVQGDSVVGGLIGYNYGGGLYYSSTNVILDLTGNTTDDCIGGLIGITRRKYGDNVVAQLSGRVQSCLSNAWLVFGNNVQKKGGLVGYNMSATIVQADINSDGVSDASYFNSDFAFIRQYTTIPDNENILEQENTVLITDTASIAVGKTSGAFVVVGFTGRNLGSYNESYDAKMALRPENIVTWAQSSNKVDLYSKKSAEMVVWRYDYTLLKTYARGTENNPYLISDGNDLAVLSETTEYCDYTGKYFSITSDLDMSRQYKFYPIGFYGGSDNNYAFNGCMDGNGHTIRDLTIDFYDYCADLGRGDDDNKYVALFGYTGKDFYLKRLVLDDSCVICGGRYTASFVGYFNGKIEECLSSAQLYAYQKVSVAGSYETGKYYVRSGAGNYSLSDEPYSAQTTYFSLTTNVGGFVGDLISSGNSIVGSVFNGSMHVAAPALGMTSSAYGFVGIPSGALTLNTENSWYFTSDAGYKHETSYGRVLVDHSDAENGGSVAIVNAWDGSGFGFSVTTSKPTLYKPFIYHNADALTYAATYYLASSAQVKFHVQFCQEIGFTIENNIGGGEPILLASGNRGDYYYEGEEVIASFVWQKTGYYVVDSVTIGSKTYTVRNNYLFHNEENSGFSMRNSSDDSFDLLFTMGVSLSGPYNIGLTLAEIGSSVVFNGISGTSTYSGETKEYSLDVASGLTATTVFVDKASNSRTVLRNAGDYDVYANLSWEDNTVVIGRAKTTCSIGKKPLSLKEEENRTEEGRALLQQLGVKVYDGMTTKTSVIDGQVLLDLLSGLIDGDGIDGDENVLPMSVYIEWTTTEGGAPRADSGESGISYTLSQFDKTTNNYSNYAFTATYTFDSGVIRKKEIVVTVDGCEEARIGENTYAVRTVDYSSYQPAAPSGTYEIGIVWSYDKMKVEAGALELDSSWTNGKYGVGYYKMSVSMADSGNESNYLLTMPDYYTYIRPKTVSAVTIETSGTLIYTGEDLTSRVSAYYLGTGTDTNHQNVVLRYFVRANVEGTDFDTMKGSLFVRGSNLFEALSEDAVFDTMTDYYVVAVLLNAGSYFIDCTSTNANYDLKAGVQTIEVQKATSSEELTFTLKRNGEETISTGGEIVYTDYLEIAFPENSLCADAGYDTEYSVSIVSAPNGGSLRCEKVEDTWRIYPQTYGREIVFKLLASGATNYNNRLSDSLVLTVTPVTLYVDLISHEQYFGEVIDFSLRYYSDPQHTSYVDPDTIEGLRAPEASTGEVAANSVNTEGYHVSISGGFSNGYVFDTSTLHSLIILPKDIYISVPAGVSNVKIYGQEDPALIYYVYSDQACNERIERLPNGEDIVLRGELGRAEGENVGSYAINGGTLITTSENPDYSIHFVSGGGTFVIMYREIKLQVAAGQGKYYSDDDQPYVLEVCEGYTLERGDPISIFTTGVKPIVSITRVAGEIVGEYAYILNVDYDLAGEGNYNLIGVDALDSYTIRRVRPTIEYTFDGAVYFGDTIQDVSHASARAYNNGNPIGGTFSWTNEDIVFNSLNVVIVTLKFTPADAHNYAEATVTFPITPEKRNVHPVFDGPIRYVYDGREHNEISVTLDNAVGSGEYSLSLTVTGDNKNVSNEGFTVQATLTSSCYVFAEDAATFIRCYVDPALVTVKVSNAAIDFGEAYLPEITYSGFVNNETERVLITSASVPEVPEESGVYTLVAQGAAAKNYTFRYVAGILSINKVFTENEGISVRGSFAPNATVEVDFKESGSMSFSDLQSDFDKRLGSNFFMPLSISMTSYYGIAFSGLKLDVPEVEDEEEITEGSYEYRLLLNGQLPENAKLYLFTSDGKLVMLEDYEVDEGELVFTAGLINGVAVYENKDQKALIMGYLPHIIIGASIIVLIMLIGIFSYFKKANGGKSKYFAERASYKVFPNRKK